MKLISNFFLGRDARRATKAIQASKSKNISIANVCSAVGVATFYSAAAFEPLIDLPTEQDNQMCRFRLQSEFLYFFIFMTTREIFATQLANERKNKYSELLKESAIDSFVSTLFEHWPKENRAGITEELSENLKSFYGDFLANLKLIKDAHEFTSVAFGCFANNVSKLLRHEEDVSTVTDVIETTVHNWNEAKISELVLKLI